MNEDSPLRLPPWQAAHMEAFRVLISFIWNPKSVDFITQLPLEVTLLILKYVDDESFSSVANVSQQWAKICRCSGRRRENSAISNSRKIFQHVHCGSRTISMNRLLKQRKGANRTASYGHSQVPSKNMRLLCNRHYLAGKFSHGRLRL